MSFVEVTLLAAALVAGLTGTWSPCGFSMVETIGMRGLGGGRTASLLASLAFMPGALAGGALTFGALAAVGAAVHGGAGDDALLIAAGIALAAAVLEARGARIVPQIRRQLPETWRWRMALPLAGALYGVLLGLGFTTFVLTFGVWALAGISFALGDPQQGILVGLAFGIGRALPIVVLAPAANSRVAIRALALMAERPSVYRAFRLGDSGALAAVGLALASSAAFGSQTAVQEGSDPSAAGRALAFQLPNQEAVVKQGPDRVHPPGTDPSISSRYVAVITGGDTVRLLDRPSLDEAGSFRADGVDAVAVSKGWIAYRVSRKGHDTIKARNIRRPQRPKDSKLLGRASRPAQLGAPAIDGNLVVYAVNKRRRNAIARRVLGTSRRGVVVSSRGDALWAPSVRGKRLLYVRTHRGRVGPSTTAVPGLRQHLVLKPLGRSGGGHSIYSRGSGGVLWSTGLTEERAYVTVLGGGEQRIVFVRR